MQLMLKIRIFKKYYLIELNVNMWYMKIIIIGRKSFFDSLNLYFEFSKYNIYYLVFLYISVNIYNLYEE